MTWNRLEIIAGSVAALFIAGAFAFALFRNNTYQHELSQSDPLVVEQKHLAAPDNARLVESCSYNAKDISHRLYSCLYTTKSSFTELASFYSLQLQTNGWRQLETTKTLNWFRDVGGHVAVFCKGNLQLSLEFAGERSGYSWQYSVGTSVGVPPYRCASS